MYFDAEYTRRNRLKNPRVTQIWQVSDPNEIGALGKLFHNSIERFHDSAAQLKSMRRLLESRPNGEVLSKTLQQWILDQNVDRGRLSRALPGQQANFQNALRLYTDELSEMLLVALAEGSQVAEVLDQMFGDRRRSVDVTFEVGPNGRQVNVVGRLDHVFYDWRRDRRRIIDFKLTPGQSIEADLYQISIYALMHHQQHGTQPDAGLLYLYPKKKMYELSWNEISSRRQEIHDLLASMVQWQEFQFQPRRGLHPPGNSNYCPACTYATICQRQLGAPNIGEVLSGTATTAVGKTETETAVNVELGSSPSEQDEKTIAIQAVEPPVEDCPKSVEPEPREDEPSGVNPQADSEKRLENGDNEALLDTSLLIGQNDSGQTVHLPVQVLPSHVAVVGASGSGKTWMAKVVAEEAIRKGIPVVAVDPQGDLVQFLRKANEDSEHFQDLCEEYTRMVEPRVFTPGTSHGRRLSISPIRVSNNLQTAGMKESRQLEERAMMLASLASNLVNLANAGSDGDLQQTFLTKVIERLTSTSKSSYSELSLKDLVSAIMAPENIGIDDVDLYLAKSQRTKLGRKLMTLIEGPRAGLFSGGEPLDMDSLCRPSTPGKIPLNVIYLNAMNDDTEKQMFVAMLATEIYRWMTSSLESTGQARVLLYFDEARDFIPSGTRRPAAKDPLIRLFAQGRKYGVACLLCTQSPRSVDYNVFSNCSTKLIGRLESSQDVERVAEWFSNDGGRPSWIAQRKSAAPGTFVARWPGMPQQQTGVCFKGRPLFSLHEGAWSPTRVESEIAQSSELSCVE